MEHEVIVFSSFINDSNWMENIKRWIQEIKKLWDECEYKTA